MTHTYKFATYGILAVGKPPIMELGDLTSVRLDRQLGGAGNFSATFRLGQSIAGARADREFLVNTVPDYHAIAVWRDGVPIWAGPITSRAYESQGQTINLTAQTYESALARTPIDANITQSAVSVATATDALLTQLGTQLSDRTDYGLTYLAPTWTPSEPTVTVRAIAAEFPMATQFLDEVASFWGGGWRIDTIADTGIKDGVLTKLTYWGNPSFTGNRAVYQEQDLGLSYPGNINAFWYTESTGGAMRHVAKVGNLTSVQNSSLGSEAADEGYDTTIANWPAFTNVKQHPKLLSTYTQGPTTAQQKLDNMALDQAFNDEAPLSQLTVELVDTNLFNIWNELGDLIYPMDIQDVRWPGRTWETAQWGFHLDSWSLEPETANSPEILRLAGRAAN